MTLLTVRFLGLFHSFSLYRQRFELEVHTLPFFFLTCLGAPECELLQHKEVHPPWRSTPSVHQLGAPLSIHSWELLKKKTNITIRIFKITLLNHW